MIDLILALFAVAVFWLGFKAGARYRTFNVMRTAVRAKLAAWFSSQQRED